MRSKQKTIGNDAAFILTQSLNLCRLLIKPDGNLGSRSIRIGRNSLTGLSKMQRHANKEFMIRTKEGEGEKERQIALY